MRVPRLPSAVQRRGHTSLAPRTDILVVNGFDRHSKNRFDETEAIDYPWIDVCLAQLARHTPADSYRVLVWDNSYLPEHRRILDAHPEVTVHCNEDQADVRHGAALDRLLRLVPDDTEFVVTLDTDAFPIRDGWLADLIGRVQAGASIAGVWRDEMATEIEPYIHPSVLVARRETLLDLDVAFKKGAGQDVGQNISRAATAAGGRLSALHRSNRRNAHFLMAGIYGDLVYHHGAGSRHASFWTSPEQQADERARVTLRDAVFRDLDGLLGWLRGEVDDDAAVRDGLGAVVELGEQYSAADGTR